MPYNKQPWNQYDKSKSIEENIENDAVVTPSKLNHIEEGFGVLEQDFAASLVAQKEAIDEDIADRDLIINGKVTSNKEDAENKIKTVDDKIAVVTKSVADNKTANDQENFIQDSKIKDIEDTYKVQAKNYFKDSNNVLTKASSFGGSVLTFLENINIQDWNIFDATNVKTTGGSSTTKFHFRSDEAIVGHSYYTSVYVKNNLDSDITTSFNTLGSTNIVRANNKKRVSTIATAKTVATKLISFNTSIVSINLDVDISRWIGIDLTETFGAGNEPSVEQMDKILSQFTNSWFDGTQNLFNARAALAEMRSLDNLKANVKQEDWTALPLSNGWLAHNTDPVVFKKDEWGNVTLRGLIKNTVTANTAFILPVGYRPKQQMFKLIIANGDFAYISINANGTCVMFKASSTNWNDISSVTFKAEQ